MEANEVCRCTQELTFLTSTMIKSLFGKAPSVKEQVRESQGELRRGEREIQREIIALQLQEKKMIAEIKAAAQKGNQQVLNVHAKSLVRLRSQIAKLQASNARLKGISSQMTTSAATVTVGNAMSSAGKAMGAMGKVMNPQKLNQDMQQFAKANFQLEQTTEMMDEAIDNALDDDEVEEETDNLVNQVLDEIGVDISASAPVASRKVAAGYRKQVAAGELNDESSMEDELATRLANLKA
ncbi:hypothetical protein CEUSTIGMA_g1248.t1 [Chlamydomonas eustigma]|uniref:Uncharacterized protein n=1 Tax=Chlamydomonas eustigma TaxID=1157962 RepID=A0A250WSI7_9CHLO|nr:hypothetical protein CEUSTIGMA_g1248.t1 [Chlamydomonas eustigma]|eukprot:GAX73797.1 hypothetical protein CEUSTIGMA_g1248.t1 [Chlamydomonas eustigma]